MPVATSQVVTAVDAFSEPVDFEVQYDHPMSAAVNGLKLAAEPLRHDVSEDIMVRMTIASSRADSAVSVERIVPLADFQELAERVQAIAPWGENSYYPDEETSQRVWDAMGELLKGAAEASDLGAFLENTHPVVKN